MSPLKLVAATATFGGILSSKGRVGSFFRHLVADLRILFADDLPWTVSVPTSVKGLGPGELAAAVTEAKRRHKIAVLRQAVHKQLILETLWEKVGIVWLLFGPLTVLLMIIAGVSWMACVMARPEILDWVSPIYWVQRLF
jgi:hypothetical protein